MAKKMWGEKPYHSLDYEMKKRFGEKVYKISLDVELGLQTIHEKTAEFIRRGYPLSVYDTAVERLNHIGIEVVTHVIAGLPHETPVDFLESVRHVEFSGSKGIKIQLLHILKNTDLAQIYLNREFEALTLESYVDLVIHALSILPEHMVIHRLTGDGPKPLLIAPEWSTRKRQVLNEIHRQMKLQNVWQGKFHDTFPGRTFY